MWMTPASWSSCSSDLSAWPHTLFKAKLFSSWLSYLWPLSIHLLGLHGGLCTLDMFLSGSLIKDVPAFLGRDIKVPCFPLQCLCNKQMQISSSGPRFAAQVLNYFCTWASSPTKSLNNVDCLQNWYTEEDFIRKYVYVVINILSTGSNQLEAKLQLQC